MIIIDQYDFDSDIIDTIQSSLNVFEGPLYKIAYIKQPDSSLQLFWVVHHLIVDSVSWRIIQHEVNQAYQQLLDGEVIQLGTKTASYQQWCAGVGEYAEKISCSFQYDYWLNEVSRIHNYFPKEISVKTLETKRFTMQHFVETQHFNTYEILLSAYIMTMNTIFSLSEISVDVEGHGREDLINVDVSTTVGWFTNLYPVTFNINPSISAVLQEVGDKMSSVPDKGMGFGPLIYMKNKLDCEVRHYCFNYLGKFNAGHGVLKMTTQDVGQCFSNKSMWQYELEINGLILNDMLVIDTTYSNKYYTDQEIELFNTSFKQHIDEIMQYCKNEVNQENIMLAKPASAMDIHMDQYGEEF
ncbi:MAG: hypothetical protein K0U23_07165 [Gammaproteobacteria bacterium]|nr:hypothetical protein [Gammaproteobacteria bacterium]